MARILNIELDIECGTSFGKAQLEAITFAIENEANISYQFQGKHYELIYNELFSIVKEIKEGE